MLVVFSVSVRFQNVSGWMTVVKNKTKKDDMRYLGQTDLIIDPEGAIKLMDYRLSVSGI